MPAPDAGPPVLSPRLISVLTGTRASGRREAPRSTSAAPGDTEPHTTESPTWYPGPEAGSAQELSPLTEQAGQPG